MSSDNYWSQYRTLLEAKGKLVNLIDVIQKLDPKACIYCVHFDEPNEVCRKAQQRPPARIIATGCEMFENNDDVPF